MLPSKLDSQGRKDRSLTAHFYRLMAFLPLNRRRTTSRHNFVIPAPLILELLQLLSKLIPGLVGPVSIHQTRL